MSTENNRLSGAVAERSVVARYTWTDGGGVDHDATVAVQPLDFGAWAVTKSFGGLLPDQVVTLTSIELRLLAAHVVAVGL